jgi:hypothetical protein
MCVCVWVCVCVCLSFSVRFRSTLSVNNARMHIRGYTGLVCPCECMVSLCFALRVCMCFSDSTACVLICSRAHMYFFFRKFFGAGCVCVCIYLCVCVYNIYIYIYIYIFNIRALLRRTRVCKGRLLHVHTYVCMYVFTCVRKHQRHPHFFLASCVMVSNFLESHMCVNMCVCICVCFRIYMYVNMRICTYKKTVHTNLEQSIGTEHEFVCTPPHPHNNMQRFAKWWFNRPWLNRFESFWYQSTSGKHFKSGWASGNYFANRSVYMYIIARHSPSSLLFISALDGREHINVLCIHVCFTCTCVSWAALRDWAWPRV